MRVIRKMEVEGLFFIFPKIGFFNPKMFFQRFNPRYVWYSTNNLHFTNKLHSEFPVKENFTEASQG